MPLPPPAEVPLRVTTLVRALDTGPTRERAWRLTVGIGKGGIVFASDLPFERGRPLELTLGLPDDPEPLVAQARVIELQVDDAPAGEDPDRPRPRAATFITPDDALLARIDRYVRERKLLP